MPRINVNEPILEDWLSRALDKPDEAFVPIGDLSFSFARVLEESKGTLAVFVKRGVNPHRVPGVQWRAHVADPNRQGDMDLLRADYQASGLRLRLTESINFVFIEVKQDMQGVVVADRGRYVGSLISVIVNSESGRPKWEFDIPDSIGSAREPVLIRSRGGPAISDLESRYDRADLASWNSRVCFIFYKKVDQLEFFQREDRWFRRPVPRR